MCEKQMRKRCRGGSVMSRVLSAEERPCTMKVAKWTRRKSDFDEKYDSIVDWTGIRGNYTFDTVRT